MSVETVTQGPVVGVEGRRVVVGRGGTPSLVGLGTSVPDFRDCRRRLAAVCCQAVVICGSLLGCRGALTREKPISAGRILVFASGVSVSSRLWEGLRGWRSWRGTKIPWGSVFNQGGAEEDDETGGLLACRAVDAKCRMAEIYEKGTQGSVLAWRAASLLLRRFLLLY